MKLRAIVKIAITSSVVLLCSGFALYSFFRLSVAESNKNFNLYELVPSSASAVFSTNDMLEFVDKVDELTCSKNQQYLHVSKLFSYLKQYLYTIQEDAPHGLSRQMSQMLISFHEPDNIHNQVLYCRLGEGDRKLIDHFIHKYISSLYPPKTFQYKGEDMTIYPMADGDFLTCYLTPDFMTLSYQKKLIEDVIDAHKNGKSLADDPGFAAAVTLDKSTTLATVYTHLDGMMGWTEFDMKLREDFIYFAGVNHEVDTSSTFMNGIRQQESVNSFLGESLPATTYYFSKQGVADWVSLLSHTDMQEQEVEARTPEVQNTDRELSRYLMENAGKDMVACLFQGKDTLQQEAAVLSLSVTDAVEAERRLRSLVEAAPTVEEKGMPHITFCYTADRAYPVYRLPQTTLFAQLTSFAESTLNVYAVFYGRHLLLAPDEESLSHYIHQLDKGEVLNSAMSYQAGMDNLSDSCHFMMMADFDHVFRQPESQLHFLPGFFIHNADFFCNFILFVQFTYTDGTVYPNVVLKYKTE